MANETENIKEKTTEQTENAKEKLRDVLYFTIRCTVKGDPTIYTPPEFLKKFKDILPDKFRYEEHLDEEFWKAESYIWAQRLCVSLRLHCGMYTEKKELLYKVQPLIYVCPKDSPDTLIFYEKCPDIEKNSEDDNNEYSLTKSQEEELDKLVSDIEKLLKEP